MNRTPSSRPSPPVGEKVPSLSAVALAKAEGRLRGIPTGSWLRFASEFWRCSLPMNRSFVAADVRRLKLLGLREIRASLRRLLRFRGSMREDLRGGILPMHRALVGQQPSWLPVSAGILPAEHLGG